MAAVSVRLLFVRSNKASGAHAHAVRTKTPGYVNTNLSENNVDVIDTGDSLVELARDVELKARSREHGRWQASSNHFIDGLIGFSHDADLTDRKMLDRCACDLLDKIIAEHDIRSDATIYLVRHEDESRPHYHFMLLSQHVDGRSARRSFGRIQMSQLQTLAGEAFAEMGMVRGKPKTQREADGEPESAYINRSVKKLHDELPQELQELQEKIDVTRARLERLKDNAPLPPRLTLIVNDGLIKKKKVEVYPIKETEVWVKHQLATMTDSHKSDERDSAFEQRSLNEKILSLMAFDQNSIDKLNASSKCVIEEMENSFWCISLEAEGNKTLARFKGGNTAIFENKDDARNALGQINIFRDKIREMPRNAINSTHTPDNKTLKI